MIECIKKIVLEKHWNETKDPSTLKDTQSKMEVQLIKLPKHGIIINVPAGGKSHLGIINNKKKRLARSCDNLILIEGDDCIDVYFIEMKETLTQEEKTKAVDQILHTIPTWDYIASMIKVHFKKNKKTNSYFAIIAKRSSNSFNKQKVKPQPPEIFTCGDKQFKIIYSALTIPFKSLQ